MSNILPFDTETHLPVAVEQSQMTQRGNMTATTLFQKWKTIGKLKMFTTLAIEQMGMDLKVTFDEISFEEIDKAVFALPEPVRKLAAGDTGGDDESGEGDGGEGGVGGAGTGGE